MGCSLSKSSLAHREKQLRCAMVEIDHLLKEDASNLERSQLILRYEVALRKIISNSKGYHMEHFYHDVKMLIESMDEKYPMNISYWQYLAKTTLQILDPVDLFDDHQKTPSSKSSFDAVDTMANATSYGKSIEGSIHLPDDWKLKYSNHRRPASDLKSLFYSEDALSHSGESCDYGFFDVSEHSV